MTYHHTTNGKKVSLLGYGAMRLPTVDGGHANQWKDDASSASIDQKLLNDQIKLLLDSGVNYFDTSPAYCRGESERCLGEALAKSGHPRSDYVLATKVSNFAESQFSFEVCRKMFEDSLKALRTDYIDNFMIHNTGYGGYETFLKRFVDNGVIDWCLELRKQGRIRNFGFSYHGDRKAFDWCLAEHPRIKWDFVQIQMNYSDWRHASVTNPNDLGSEYLYRTLTDLKLPIVVMEPLLGGRLARYNYALAKELKPLDPEASLARWALRFCGSFDNVMTVLSGMTRMEHVKENIETFSPLRPCTEAEFAALERAAEAMLKQNTIPCNKCNYCMPCPYGLDIPAILTFVNWYRTQETKPTAAETLRMYRRMVPNDLRTAEHCTSCGRCSPHCPQSIDIVKELAAVDKWIEELKNEMV